MTTERIHSRKTFAAGRRFAETKAPPKYLVYARATVIEPVSRQTVSGWTLAISDVACSVRSAQQLPARSVVQVRIEQKGETFEIWARITQTQPKKGMQLAFFQTAESHLDLLKSWMKGVKPAEE